MKVLLTGGTGYLGASIARALLAADHQVLALVRDRERAAWLVGCGASLVEGDVDRPDRWANALAGVDGLIHAAGVVAAWGPPPARFDRINVDASLELLDRAARAGVKRRVQVGSPFSMPPSPDGSPRDEAALDLEPDPVQSANDYVRTKSKVTRLLRARQRDGDDVIMTFPTVLLGPGTFTPANAIAHVFSDIGRGRFPGLVGDGQQKWNMVPVDDAARGHVLALEKGTPGENYILGGEDWTQERIVRAAAEAFGRTPPLRRLGVAFPLTVARISEAVAALIRKPPLLTRGEVLLYDRHWAYTSVKAQRDLGYATAPVAQVIIETVNWLKDEIWPRKFK